MIRFNISRDASLLRPVPAPALTDPINHPTTFSIYFIFIWTLFLYHHRMRFSVSDFVFVGWFYSLTGFGTDARLVLRFCWTSSKFSVGSISSRMLYCFICVRWVHMMHILNAKIVFSACGLGFVTNKESESRLAIYSKTVNERVLFQSKSLCKCRLLFWMQLELIT